MKNILKDVGLLVRNPPYRFRLIKTVFQSLSRLTTYSFSAVNTTYGLQADNLQFFSAPVYLGVESGNHSLEMGVSLDLLLAARGKLQQVAIEDQSHSHLRKSRIRVDKNR